MRRAHHLVVIATSIAAALTLTGCVDAPDPDPRPTPAPSVEAKPRPTPSQSPGPEPIAAPAPLLTAADTTHITVRPEHLELMLDDGTLIDTLSYDADVDTFVGALTEAFGDSPSVEELPGGHEWHPATRYTWPGVTVNDDHEYGDMVSDMNVNIRFTHPIVAGGVSVSTVQGFQPGDSIRAFADRIGEEWRDGEYSDFPAETGPDIGERMYDSYNDTYSERANANAVAVSEWHGNPNGSTGSEIHAPWNFGIGHV
jgi:hypothetical protein